MAKVFKGKATFQGRKGNVPETTFIPEFSIVAVDVYPNDYLVVTTTGLIVNPEFAASESIKYTFIGEEAEQFMEWYESW